MVDRDFDLASTKAWALFHLGCWKEARAVNDTLLQQRRDHVDLLLDINLALQSGDWERFPVIIDREWPRRDEHDASTLMYLASVAAEVDATAARAFELTRLAASKAPNDPRVLINAYALVVRLGRDDDADPGWIARAAELSSNNGPVWKASLRTMAEEMIPAHRERTRIIEQDLIHGKLSLHAAAAVLGMPLSRVLTALSQDNAERQDSRRRVMIPIISGARPAIEIQAEWTVGLDVTSIMVLVYLGLLRKALDAFQRVGLAPDTMVLLLNERRRVRFHQPSRVKKAEEVRELIDEKRLKPAPSLSDPPPWLVDEVGRDLAEMLEAARATGGRVVRPYPIYKPSTFMEREAELGNYAQFVISTSVFTRLLFKEGYIDAETHEHALRYLGVHDRDQGGEDDPSVLGRPLYLDDLAVTYLQEAGLLRKVCHRGLDLQVHPSTRAEQDALIAANREGEKLADMLDGMRRTLHEAIDVGKAVFIPQHARDREETGFGAAFEVVPILAQADVGPCDAVCIDDRFLNRHITLTDRARRSVPVVCVLDVLRHLEARGSLDAKQRQAAVHRLRAAGYALMPVEPDALEQRLRTARCDQQGLLTESAELRVLRQTLMRIRSLDMLDQPVETPFLTGLLLASILVMRRLWKDEALPAPCAAALSDWVWRNIVPSLLDWQCSIRDLARMTAARDGFVQCLAVLLRPMPRVKSERYEAFRGWAERAVIEPLLPANANFIDTLAALIQAEIEQWSGEFENHASSAAANYLCNLQPLPIRTRLLKDSAFMTRFGLIAPTAVTVGRIGTIDQQELFAAARCAIAHKGEQRVVDLDGRESLILADQDGVALKRASDGEQPLRVQFNDLIILSPHREERTRALDRLLDRLGPTAPDYSKLRQAAEERELNDHEAAELLSEAANGVAARQARTQAALQAGQARLDDLVPQSLPYFERFCGPEPREVGPEEYLNAVPTYRKGLLQRDLARGLDICLLGALRDDLTPGAWTEHLSDDELWNALAACDPRRDPFSLLGALDIALGRQHDERYRAFAEEAVAKLLQEEFPRSDGLDTYELLPLLAGLALDRINTLEGGPPRAPYWKRMCAWMQAGLLVRLTYSLNLDLDRLRDWVRENRTPASVYAKILDLRREPMYRAAEMSQPVLRGEVLGRLVALRWRHETAGRTVPRAQDIDEAIARLTDQGSPLAWTMPGPLEGHRRPAESAEHRLSAEDVSAAIEELGQDPEGPVWSRLAYFSQCFDLGESLLSRARDTIVQIAFQDQGKDREKRLERLEAPCLVAIVQRDTKLARAIADRAISVAHEIDSAKEIGLILQALLLASAVFGNEEEWAPWLAEQLAQLAARLPAGEASKVLLEHLKELKRVVPLTCCVCARAEALASAAG